VGGHTMAVERQGTPVEVDPGSIEVRIERDGVMVASRRIEVGGDQPLQADVALEVPPRGLAAAPPAAPAPLPGPRAAVQADVSHAEPSEPVTSKAWFWAAGAGVVVAATATVLLVALSGGVGGSSAREPVAGDAGTIAGKVIPIP